MIADYYENHAEDYFRATAELDMSEVRARFKAHVPLGSAILDAGCGSGRDTLSFANEGYNVTALDASPSLAQMAQTLTGQVVHVMRFCDMPWEANFEGIWACASLVHMDSEELLQTLHQFHKALTPSGVLFICLKHGTKSYRDSSGRSYCRHNKETLEPLLHISEFAVKECWLSSSVREPDVQWINVISQRIRA